MSNNIHIRQALACDYDAIYRFLSVEHDKDYAIKAFLTAFEDKQGALKTWLALENNKIIGLNTTRDVEGCVYVSPSYRFRGIGSQLMQARDDFIKKQGLKGHRIHVPVTQTGVLNLYQKYGYSIHPASLPILEYLVQYGKELCELSEHPPLLMMTK